MTSLKLIFYTVIINVLRYFPGGLIESYTIFEPMHKPMEDYPDCFGFTDKDLPASFAYNFVLWLSVVLIFHIAHKSLHQHMLIRSLIIYGLCCLFFVSLAAVYMNHYTMGIRTFYLYSMLDGLILFTYLGVINGFLYPLFFKQKK